MAGAVAPATGKPPLAVPRRILRMRSDAALAERFVAGDEAAFDVIYERHRPTVLAVCMGILGTPHDAEDATQETFSSLALALRTHPPQELRPWLTRVARNASIDTTRRRRHRLLTLDGEIPEIPVRPSTAANELSSVLDGIRELPEGQRTALLMRELGGHSYAEIAAFLDVDEDAVRGLIARARVGLRTYREATEMPCASARAAIESEPDGRRHDKTVRRHLRSCSSCRSYRTALRGDAKALRAVFPWQAGGLAGTGLAAGGAMGAAKSAMVGVGLSQLAATCAASVCAVGAVGGVVLLDPAHRIFNPVQLSAAPVKHQKHHSTSKPHVAQSHVSASASSSPAVSSAPVEQPTAAPTTEATHTDKTRHAATGHSWHHGVVHHRFPAGTADTTKHGHPWGWQQGNGSGSGTYPSYSGDSGGQSAGSQSTGTRPGGDSGSSGWSGAGRTGGSGVSRPSSTGGRGFSSDSGTHWNSGGRSGGQSDGGSSTGGHGQSGGYGQGGQSDGQSSGWSSDHATHSSWGHARSSWTGSAHRSGGWSRGRGWSRG